MARTIYNTTTTSNEFDTLFDDRISRNPQLNKQIEDVKNDTKLYLGKILRFYNVRDLALVRNLNTGVEEVCVVSHEILSSEVSLDYMCNGGAGYDNTYGHYIKPYGDIYGIIAQVRWEGLTDKSCLLGCVNLKDNASFRSNSRIGEIKLTAGESSVSVMKNRVNIITPALFVNGLPYTSPRLDNYYTKDETSVINSSTESYINVLEETVKSLTSRIDKLVETNNLIEEDEADESNG